MEILHGRPRTLAEAIHAARQVNVVQKKPQVMVEGEREHS